MDNFLERTSENSVLIVVNDVGDSYEDELRQYFDTGQVYVVGVQRGRRGCVDPLNAAVRCTAFADNFRYVAFQGDDHRPRTWHWDERYMEKLRDMGLGMVYGDDMLQGEIIPTQIAMTSNIPRTLGWMAPPGLRHLFVDNAWKAIGQKLGRIIYMPDVIVEHMHPLAGKAENDVNYAQVNHAVVAREDQAEFNRYMREDIERDVERLNRVYFG